MSLFLQSASGTGLAFILFTEAVNQFPGGNFWAILFFMMLFTLGLDSQFGTLQGVIQCFIDLKLLPNLRKEILTGEAIKRCPIWPSVGRFGLCQLSTIRPKKVKPKVRHLLR